jgi:hypothetical protein
MKLETTAAPVFIEQGKMDNVQNYYHMENINFKRVGMSYEVGTSLDRYFFQGLLLAESRCPGAQHLQVHVCYIIKRNK